jgi:superfamily I DNA and/or RNA helicase
MNRAIMAFPNIQFYEGKLQAAEEVAERRLEIAPAEVDAALEEVLRPDRPLVFVNTSTAAKEHARHGSTSKENPGEAALTKNIAEGLLQLGVHPRAVGIITPYEDQVDLLRQSITTSGLQIATVDGFQGREKDVILVSFVRSNPEGDIGFLEDLRRLNVSLTRARKKLILIGDETTLSHSHTYRRLIAAARESGGYVESW